MHAGGGDRTGGGLRPPGKESRAPARSCHHIQQPSPSAGDETSEKQSLFSVKVHFLLLAPPSGLHTHAHPKVNANTPKFSGESSLFLPVLSKASAKLPDTRRRSEGGTKASAVPGLLATANQPRAAGTPGAPGAPGVRAAGARGGQERVGGGAPPGPRGAGARSGRGGRGGRGRTGALCRRLSFVLAPAGLCRRRLPPPSSLCVR